MHQPGDMVELEIPQWLADKEGYDTRYIEGVVKAATDKAILVETVDGDEVWLPRKAVE